MTAHLTIPSDEDIETSLYDWLIDNVEVTVEEAWRDRELGHEGPLHVVWRVEPGLLEVECDGLQPDSVVAWIRARTDGPELWDTRVRVVARRVRDGFYQIEEGE